MKDKIDKNYIIIVDTNVLLNVYRYSPEVSEFALECMKAVKEYIYLPATVYLEYKKHYRAEFSKMERKVAEAGSATEQQIKSAKKRILDSCSNLERLQYPDVDELREALSEKMDGVQTELDNYFYDHASLSFIQYSWKGTDYVESLVEDIVEAGHILDSPTQEDIYRWCEDGERRYKNEIPPGFKDAKNKDGVRKYSDLILWNEIMRFAKTHEKDIIFVTDDVKADWWEDDNGNRVFHAKLVAEFEKTGKHLYPITSQVFLSEISDSFGVEKSDVIEIALRMTDDDYCYKIADDVFEKAEEYLMFNALEFIDEDSANIGSEGIDEYTVRKYEYVGAERTYRDDNFVIYEFKYRISLEGTSYEYWGKDSDTQEIIRSDGRDHIFDGEIVVAVQRDAGIFYDFETDNSFKSADVVYGVLKETRYSERSGWDNPPGELGNCPECGCTLNVNNDGGNGFCFNCAWKH